MAMKTTSMKSKKKKHAEAHTDNHPESDCPHCKEGPEYYRMLFNLYKFDVDMARQIVADGREAFELETEDVQHSLDWSRIYPQHLAHVDTKYPGIIAHYWFPQKDAEPMHGHVLIDGHHRAAKALELGIPFYVHILSEEESRAVTMRCPDLEQIEAKRQELAEDRARDGDRRST
jgi:hypothetical protein